MNVVDLSFLARTIIEIGYVSKVEKEMEERTERIRNSDAR
jgi:hypothetical protein